MADSPMPLALSICEDVVQDADSQNFTLVRIFTGTPVPEFPGSPHPFRVHAALTNGDGLTEFIILAQESAEGFEEVYRVRGRLNFHDKLHVINLSVQIGRCIFPRPGLYTFFLLIDGETVAQRSLRVYQEGE